jgi:hypothetical protein
VSFFAFSRFDQGEAISESRASAALPDGIDASFQILHGLPAGPVEAAWRACLAESDFPTHYTAPEYFCEPALRGRNPFAVLSVVDGDVRAVLTGVHYAGQVQSGLSNRPQIAFSRRADQALAMKDLLAGLLREAGSSKLVDVFLWSDMAGLVDAPFRQKPYRGVFMLDLLQGPDALFRKFTKVRRKRIRRAIKYGVSVEPAKSRDDISAYYSVYVDWAPRRRGLPLIDKEQFHEEFLTTKNNRRLLLARYKSEVIAGIVLRFFPGGVMEYAGDSSLQSTLHVRPNDLLHWRAIEWACAEGLTKYGLGSTDLFQEQFGGEIVTTIRHRLDRSLFRRHTIGDWMADRIEVVRPFIPQRVAGFGRSVRSQIRKFRYPGQLSL